MVGMQKLIYTLVVLTFSIINAEEQFNGFASEKQQRFYETLLHEACTNVKTPMHKCQNIRAETLKVVGVVASTNHETKTVIINKFWLRYLTYGQLRATLHHEAVHLNQVDSLELYIAQHMDPCVSRLQELHSAMETEADTIGLPACKCSKCVYELLRLSPDKPSSGYLDTEQRRAIADKLYAKRLLCEYHSSWWRVLY